MMKKHRRHIAVAARFDAKPQLLAVSSILLCSSWTTFDEDLIV